MTDLPFRGRRFWKLILTSCRQGSGAPFIDRAFTRDQEGNRYRSLAIHLRPWQRTAFGDRAPGTAFVVGWRERHA